MESALTQEPVHIVTQDGMTLTFMVFLRMNVQDLKEKLVERLGLDMEEIHNIRLYYRGRTLNNMYTLEECNVTRGAVIYQINPSRQVEDSKTEHKIVVNYSSETLNTPLITSRLRPAGYKPNGQSLGLF